MHCKARHDKVQYYGRQKSMYHKKKTCRIYHLVQLVWYKSCVCWGRVLIQLLPVTYIWIKADPIYNSSSKIFYKSLA